MLQNDWLHSISKSKFKQSSILITFLIAFIDYIVKFIFLIHSIMLNAYCTEDLLEQEMKLSHSILL